ncbi:LamG domain-containing protein [Kitasatospora sp. NPDC051914]|uniref:LamG domain-containing protein n=1 Tax=Kitasatospora sp. NPDC051914 TaxID=3154945 RepID=UPI0034331FE6
MPIPSLTTEYSETTATPQGHLALTTHPDQQRTKATGTWQTLDADLARNGDGSFSPKASANPLVLSKGGGGSFATMTSSDGKKLSLSLPFALPAPTVTGPSVLYPNVLPDIDLKVTATKFGGVTTVLIVKTQAAAANSALKTLHFDTEGEGIAVKADAGGNLSAQAADGKPRWTAPAPRMWDSTTGAAPAGKDASQARALSAETETTPTDKAPPTGTADGPGAYSKIAPMPVAADTDGIDLAPDQNLLSTGTAPYFIDPAWIPSTTSANAWTWVQSAQPTANNWNRTGSADSEHPGAGLCGYYAAGGSCSPSSVYRTYYQFDTRSLRGAVFHYATMNLQEYVSADWSCTNTYPLDLYLTGGIYDGVNWGNKPGSIGGSLGRQWVGGSGHGSCYGNVPFSYTITGTLQQYGGDHDTLTFGLYGDEGNQNGFKRFTYQPSLYVEYDRAPNLPTNPHVNPAPKTVTPSTTYQACDNSGTASWAWLGAGSDQASAVTLNATVSSPTQAQLYTWAHIWDYNLPGAPDVSSGYSPLVASGSNAPFTVATGAIKDGHSYGFSIMASDQLPGVPWSGATPICHFRVDLTPPTLAFDPTVSDTTTQFPPAGNGQTPKIYAGQTGSIPFKATDPNPSGLNTSGLACLRWSWDPQFNGASWQCGTNMPSNQITGITPTRWGTQILYLQAQDNAGNLSPVAPYAFYVPWNASSQAPSFGDITGDSAPDIVTPDTAGNLRAYPVPGNPQASSAAVTLAAKPSNSPDKDSWALYQKTHRGSLRGGTGVDDLLVHKTASPSLYAFKNPNNSGVTGAFDTSVPIDKPSCETTYSLNTSCTNYSTDWSATRQIAALGDPTTTNLDTAKKFLNKTGLFTVETTGSNDAALWYYPAVGESLFGPPVKVAATGWFTMDLISPGDWSAQGRPGLWARDRANGSIHAYTLSLGTATAVDEFGTPAGTYPTVTALATDTNIGTAPAATYPVLGSDGDLNGDGLADLWTVGTDNAIKLWPGTGSNRHVNALGTPITAGSTSAAADQWRLAGNTTDSTGDNPATATGNTTWTADHASRPNSALTLNNTYLKTTTSAVDTSQSYSVSAWVKINTAAGYQTFVTQNGNDRGAFYLQYSPAFGTWAFVAPSADKIPPAAYYAARASGPAAPGTWTHLVGTYDVTTHVMTLYVNGTYAGSTTNPTPWAANGPLTIGAAATANHPADNQVDGAVSDVRTYPYALTAEQVSSLAAS